MTQDLAQKGECVADEVVDEVFKRGRPLSEVLAKAIRQHLDMTVSEFSQKSGIPMNTLYKILSGKRDPNLRTFCRIVETLRKLEQPTRRRFIAIIGSRVILDNIEYREIKYDDETLEIREYAVTTIEEAMIAAVQAERDGASGLVCAPILSPTLEKLVRLPVVTIKPRESIIRAIETLTKKISSGSC